MPQTTSPSEPTCQPENLQTSMVTPTSSAALKLGYVSEQHMKSWSDLSTKTWDDYPEDIQDSAIRCCSLNFTLGEQRDMFGASRDELDSYCEQRLEFLMSTVPDVLVILHSETRSRRSNLFVEVLDLERRNKVLSMTEHSANERDVEIHSKPGQRIFRHLFAEMCPIGALGFSLLSTFGTWTKFNDGELLDWLKKPLLERSFSRSTNTTYFRDVQLPRSIERTQSEMPPEDMEQITQDLCEYNLNRYLLETPAEFMLFPWALERHKHYTNTVDHGGVLSHDETRIYKFCELLVFLSDVILQDAAVMLLKDAGHPFLCFFIQFQDVQWRDYVERTVKKFLLTGASCSPSRP